MNLSLSKKLVFGGSILLLVPLLILGWYATDQASDGLNGLGRSNVQNVAQRVADMIQLTMQGEIKIARELGDNPLIVEVLSQIKQQGGDIAPEKIEALDSYLVKGLQRLGQDYAGTLVTDTKGVIVASNQGKKMRGVNLAERSYVKNALSGKPDASDVVISKDNGKPVSVVAVPVNGPNGEILGVTAILLDIEFLAKKVTGFKVGDTGYAWVVNGAGAFIMHPNPELILKSNVKELQGMENVSRRMLAGETGVEGYMFKGIKKLCSFAHVDLTGWSLAVTQDEEEFMGPVNRIQNGIMLIAGIALASAIILILLLARGITRPIIQVAQGLDMASHQVAAASTQVASTSQQLAEGSSEQAASLEETSSALEELASMTQQSADNAQQANSLSQETSVIVDRTGQIMSDFTHSMDEISQAAKQTAGIIKTIDEIAFQTNLLALNAAVEAARAGDAGAGFAVVADEVRNLALRSAEAARETAELIDGTVKKVETGTVMVNKSDEAFKEVAQSSHKVTELMAEIAAAASEQSQGIGQINTTVSTMDKVTQNSAANAEETASASEELNGQAESLQEYVANLVKVVQGTSRTPQSKAVTPGSMERLGAKKALPGAGQGMKSGAKPAKRGNQATDMDDDDFTSF
jgi:methyl-accepting chemotaxis protein